MRDAEVELVIPDADRVVADGSHRTQERQASVDHAFGRALVAVAPVEDEDVRARLLRRALLTLDASRDAREAADHGRIRALQPRRLAWQHLPVHVVRVQHDEVETLGRLAARYGLVTR